MGVMIFERLICAVAGHKYVVEKILSKTSRKVGCTRCTRQWAMNDDARAFLPWDAEFEEFYKSFPGA